jgi:hypothetical protein
MKLTVTINSTPRPTSEKMLKRLLLETACKGLPSSVAKKLQENGHVVYHQPDWADIEYVLEE